MTTENEQWNATRDLVAKVTQDLKDGKKDEAKNQISTFAKSCNLGYFTAHLLKQLNKSRAESREAGTPRYIAKEMYEMFGQALEQVGRTEDAQNALDASRYL